MIEDIVELAGVIALTVATLFIFYSVITHISTPSVCYAVKLVLENPGSRLVTYGRFFVWSDEHYVYLSCGLAIERTRIVTIKKTEGVITVESTYDGKIFIY
jgi:hypothetical protein